MYNRQRPFREQGTASGVELGLWEEGTSALSLTTEGSLVPTSVPGPDFLHIQNEDCHEIYLKIFLREIKT